MDHATKFSHRHSLNGREAAAHFQGQTEHYMSSARLIRRGCTAERSSLKRSAHVCVTLICTDILSQSRKNCSRVSSWKMKKETVLPCYSVPN